MLQIQSYCYVIRCYASFKILFILFYRRMDGVDEGSEEQIEQTEEGTEEPLKLTEESTEEESEQIEESTEKQLEQIEEGTNDTTQKQVEELIEKDDEGEEEENLDDTSISLTNTPSVSSVSFSVNSTIAATESLPKKIWTSLDDHQLIISTKKHKITNSRKINWVKVASMLEGYTKDQCKNRFKYLYRLRKSKKNN